MARCKHLLNTDTSTKDTKKVKLNITTNAKQNKLKYSNNSINIFQKNVVY